ncbi:MAG: hypothetical protein IT384_16130 [Deltaproteobacteria bacterium]|nr:hypothetical protein [Deltaproteobacteria bacterium]
MEQRHERAEGKRDRQLEAKPGPATHTEDEVRQAVEATAEELARIREGGGVSASVP